jgi:hypothetical protein
MRSRSRIDFLNCNRCGQQHGIVPSCVSVRIPAEDSWSHYNSIASTIAAKKDLKETLSQATNNY